jgi:putative ABC transport system substrate-binding protein
LIFASNAPADQVTRSHVRIGLVVDGGALVETRIAEALRDRLAKLGYAAGKDFSLEERMSNGDQSRLPALVRELLDRNVAVIVTNGTPATLAAKQATSNVPIVAIGMADPVRAGLVASHAHPGGNVTGLSMGFAPAFSGKWLEILQEVVPRLTTVAVVVNPNNPMHQFLRRDVAAAAANANLRTRVIEVSGTPGLDGAFKEARQNAQAMLLFGDAATFGDIPKIAALAAASRLPVMYGSRIFVEQGGLISYAPDVRALVWRAADFVDMIARGTRAADIPIEEPSKFELVVNLSTAQALGINIPQSVLLRADEVIR